MLNYDDLRKEIFKFYENQKPEPREFIVHTGEGGDKMFQHALEVQLTRDRLKLVKGISKEERKNIKAMIGSPDHDNLTVAQLLIEQYGQ